MWSKERLSNNEVMRKIRIAMSYKDEDMIHALQLADFRISKSELSAFLESLTIVTLNLLAIRL